MKRLSKRNTIDNNIVIRVIEIVLKSDRDQKGQNVESKEMLNTMKY